jgi:hypothetical protein
VIFDGSLAARQPHGIVFRSEVSDQRRDAIALTKQRESFFQEHGLARAGARYQTDDENSCAAESLAQRPGCHIILFENVFPDFD